MDPLVACDCANAAGAATTSASRAAASKRLLHRNMFFSYVVPSRMINKITKDAGWTIPVPSRTMPQMTDGWIGGLSLKPY
jgi:hypothetical protein